MNMIDKLKKARTALVLENVFFGHLALRLELVEANSNPALGVSCPTDRFPAASSSAPMATGAQIRALIAPLQPVAVTPIWAPSADRRPNIMLSADWISAAEWPGQIAGAGSSVVLVSAESPLVVMHTRIEGAFAIVDTVIDMNHPQFVRQPEYAAFVAALIDRATQRQLLDETVSIYRDDQASIVIPATIVTQSERSSSGQRIAATPLSAAFLLAALLLFALDTALFLRTRRGARNA